MSIQFMTTITDQEFKAFLKDALREIMQEQRDGIKEQQPEILDIRQAANFLKLKMATLYEKTSRKLIPHFKKGNKLYFHLVELQQWVKQGKVQTVQEIECQAITYTMNKR